MSAPQFRPTTLGDQPRLLALMQTVWDGDKGAVLYHRSGRAAGVVAEVGGQVVGYAHLASDSLHPTFEYVGVHVHPDFRRQGIGAALWQQVVRGQTKPLKTATYTHLQGAKEFLERRGLQVEMQTHMPTLDPNAVDAAQVEAWAAAARAAGFELLPMSALAGPEVRRQVTRLHLDVYAHTHEHDPPSEETEEEAEADFLGDDLRPHWLWVARQGGVLARLSSVRDMGDYAAFRAGN